MAKKHTTLYEARNLACEKARGEYIAFLDCDDEWYEDFLSKRKIFLKINFMIFHFQTHIFFGKK